MSTKASKCLRWLTVADLKQAAEELSGYIRQAVRNPNLTIQVSQQVFPPVDMGTEPLITLLVDQKGVPSLRFRIVRQRTLKSLRDLELASTSILKGRASLVRENSQTTPIDFLELTPESEDQLDAFWQLGLLMIRDFERVWGGRVTKLFSDQFLTCVRSYATSH